MDEHKGIVVGVDGSAGAAEALRWALREAQLRQLEVTAVMTWNLLDQRHPGGESRFDPDYGEDDALATLDAAVVEAVGDDAATVKRLAVNDLPARGILDAGEGADLLVVGARGLGGFKGLLLGSVSQQVLQHATSPVAVVRASTGSGAGSNRIVVGVDGSRTATAALRWAGEEARLRGATLVAVHAWSVPYAGIYPYVGDAYDTTIMQQAAKETIDDAITAAGIPEGVTVTREVSIGTPARAILDVADHADLVVVGARGLGGFTGMLFGSTSQHVTRHAPCPVVVIPADAAER